MTITFQTFDTQADFKKFVDQIIAETKSAMGIQMKRIDQIKAKQRAADKTKAGAATKQLSVGEFRVLVNPTAEYEVKVMEDVFTSLQEKVDVFESSKAILSLPGSNNAKIGVILNDGLPTGFMLFSQ